MTARRGGLLATLILALAAPMAPQPPAPSAADWQIERFDREIEVAAGVRLVIENPFGDLRIRAGDPGRVRVHAVTQRHAHDPRAFRLEDTPATADGLRLVVVAASAGEAPEQPEWGRRRADLAVEVPATAELAAITGAGLIDVRGLAGALTLRSAAGDLRLRVAGPVDARSERGSIVALLGGERWHHAARFEAPSGDVEVQFPARADADVVLETPGRLITDYSLVVERLGPLDKRGRARLGRGGAEVLLRSGRGDLAILQQPPAPASPRLLPPPAD